MPSANSASSKSMDVAKPGKATPDTTARPVIVGHKPLLKQDPMMSGDAATAEAPKTVEEKPLTVHAEKIITPPSVSTTDSAVEKEPTPTEPANPEPTAADSAPPEKPSEKPAETTPLPAEEEKTDEPPVSDDAAVVDALAEQAGANRKKNGELTAEEKKKQEALEKLIEEKKYFIPIKVASHKRHSRWSLVVLIVLLVLVGGYLVLDANVISLPFDVPFDIIKT